MSCARKPPAAVAPQADLFGDAHQARPKDETPVELPLQRCGDTASAWLLRPGLKGAEAKWAPKALVRELHGRAGVFRMPRWVAAERGWA